MPQSGYFVRVFAVFIPQQTLAADVELARSVRIRSTICGVWCMVQPDGKIGYADGIPPGNDYLSSTAKLAADRWVCAWSGQGRGAGQQRSRRRRARAISTTWSRPI